MTGIYGILNLSNGKWYVGQSVDIDHRKNQHIGTLRNGTHKNSHLQSAFNKYGEKSFCFIVLEECKREMLEDREKFWIKNKSAFENGYNKTIGGEGVHGWVPTEEYRRNASIRFSGKGNPYYGRKHSEETRKKLRETHRGERHVNYGKHLSYETRKKIGESQKGKKLSDETKRKLSEANKGKKIPKETLDKISKFMKSEKNPCCKPVTCIETGIKYISAADAARKTGLERSKISAVCRGERHKTGGLSWKFAEKTIENAVKSEVEKGLETEK